VQQLILVYLVLGTRGTVGGTIAVQFLHPLSVIASVMP
jgi:hypothetical protein